MKKRTILIKNAVCLDQSLKDFYIEEENIVEIDKEIKIKADLVIDCQSKKAILPGLINSHTHTAMSFLQGYADDLPLKEWLEKKIWPKEAQLGSEDIYWATKLAALKMIKAGTTCFNDMYWQVDASWLAVQEMGLRAHLGLFLIDSQSNGGSKEEVQKKWEILSKKETSLLSLTLAPHSIYTLSLENLTWAKNFSQRNKLPIHIHCSETKKEVEDCLKTNQMRPVEYLNEIGLLTPQTLLVHAIWLSKEEIEILKEKKCQIVYSPCSNMKLGSGIFPYSQLKEAGINICLGTDGSASNNSLDLWSEMKFASLLQRAQNENSSLLPVQEVFNLATKNAAQAFNLNAGELKIGKLADFILIDLNHLNFIPNHDLLSNLIYAQSSAGLISDVFCNGQAIMRDYRIKDEEKIITESHKRIQKLFKTTKVV